MACLLWEIVVFGEGLASSIDIDPRKMDTKLFQKTHFDNCPYYTKFYVNLGHVGHFLFLV